MKINIGLVFEQLINNNLIEYSQKIGEIYSSSYILGIDSLPHATILQIDVENLDLEYIWHTIKNNVELRQKITLAGLCILPTNSNEIWLEIPILKSASIQKLQESVINLDIFKDKQIFNGIADNFRPHITVGFIDNFQQISSTLPTIYSLLRKQDLTSFLAIGEVGDNYTFKKILKS